MKKNSRFTLRLLLCAVAFVAAILFLRTAQFREVGDDYIYKTSIDTWGSWANWAHAYYYGNSGRVLIHALLIIFLNMPIIVWKLVSAAVVAVTCCMIYRFATEGSEVQTRWTEIFGALLPVALFFLIPRMILANSIKWAAGSLNYLYPVCAMLICLFAFWKVQLGKGLGWKLKTAVALSVCLCGNMEQSSAVLIAMGLLCFAYFYFGKGKAFWREHSKDIIFLAVIWAINTAIAVIGFLAPGNDSRYVEEILGFAGFGMYNTVEKFTLGLQLFVLYFYTGFELVLWLIPSLSVLVGNLRRRNFAGMVAPLVNIVLSGMQYIILHEVFDLQFVHPYSWGYLLWLGFTVALLFFNGSILLKAARNRDQGFWLLFMYYAMVVAGVVVSLSPTLYVSASRTTYISFALLVMIIVMMFGFAKLSGEKEKKDRFWTRWNFIFGAVVTVAMVALFALGTGTVKQVDIGSVSYDPDLRIQNVTVDPESGMVRASVEVEPFFYTADNWCLGEEEGYDINVRVGILDPESDTIRIYKTYIHPQYPVMSEYPDGMIELSSCLRADCELEPGQQLVVVCIDHWGKMYYTLLPQ